MLLPVRDGMPYLAFTARTLTRAAAPPIEIVVVDDGSLDGTPAFLADWAVRDPRVRVNSPGRVGLVAALNAGLDACRAPFVARVDADDLVAPERFVRQLARLVAEELDVVGTGVRCFPATAVAGGLRRYEAWQNGLTTHDAMARERFVESPLVHPSVMFRRAAVLAVGGYRAMGYPEDYDLWLRLFSAGARFGKCPEVLTFWRERPDRLTRTAAVCTPEAIADCKVEHLLAGPLRGAQRIYVAGAGDDAKRLATRLRLRGQRIVAFLDLNPRRVGQHIGEVPVRRLEDVRADLGGGSVVLAAIGGAGRRSGVRAYFEGHGLMECQDFWLVA